MPEGEPALHDPNQPLYAAKEAWHREQSQLPLPVKVRILLELQRQDYELLKRHRPLEWWERPWEIEP